MPSGFQGSQATASVAGNISSVLDGGRRSAPGDLVDCGALDHGVEVTEDGCQLLTTLPRKLVEVAPV